MNRQFAEYVGQLEASARAALAGDDAALLHINLGAVLNGAVGAALRQSVPLDNLQELGAFFTGADLRARAIAPLLDNNVTQCAAWDPACGAGDLLLSFAERLPIGPDLEGTITTWGRRLFGTDIEPLFLRAARARLVLAAYYRGARTDGESPALESTFPGLKVQDCLAEIGEVPVVDHIVLNPPFIHVPAPDECAWGRGRVSAAALVTERCVMGAAAGTSIVAILPDVLRSGSRYATWRTLMERHVEISRVDIYGPFDPQADVDVFIIEMTKRHTPLSGLSATRNFWKTAVLGQQTLGDYCRVSVGSVVPHRHKEDGPDYPYLHTSDAIPWGTLNELLTRRRFKGRVEVPPFVVVRRTSSPSDKERAIGTIVLGEEPVAVENHLLIIRPTVPTVAICQEVLDVLRSPRTREWLDQRIRCRHLTVGSVRTIPWPGQSAYAEEAKPQVLSGQQLSLV